MNRSVSANALATANWWSSLQARRSPTTAAAVDGYPDDAKRHPLRDCSGAVVRIVLRNHPTFHITDIAQDEAVALKCWYANDSTEDEDATALSVIRTAAARDGWIECDCLPGPLQPLMYPRRDEHVYTLVRMNCADDDPRARVDRPNHAESCPFFFDKTFDGSAVDRRFILRPVAPKPSAYFDPLPALAENIADRSHSPSFGGSGRSDRPSALGIQLWRLLYAAQKDVIPPLQVRPEITAPIAAHLRDLRIAAHGFKVARATSLSWLLSTWPGDYFDPRSRWQRNVSSVANWPDGTRPTAFMIVAAKLITDNRIYPLAQSGFIEVASRIRRPLRGDPKQRGPFLVLANFDRGDDNDGPLRPTQAYAQPMHALDTMIPVESGFERDVLNLLLWLQARFLKAAPKVQISISKPLFALATSDKYCRPDFILDVYVAGAGSQRMIIEAMGFDTPEYEEQKAITLPRMALLGPVFEVRPSDLFNAVSAQTSHRLTDWIIDHIQQ